MADATYGPKVYLDQGGDRIVCASGGTIIVESGGTLELSPGSTIDTDMGLVHYDDDVSVGFGTGDDVTLTFDGTKFVVAAAADDTVIQVGDGTNSFDVKLFGGTSGHYLLWDASANTLTVTGGVNVVLDATTGTKIGTGTTQKLGFFNATPVAQQSGTSVSSSGFTAGSGTAVKDDSTFTGAVGSTAYHISDIVAALKNLGLLAA